MRRYAFDDDQDLRLVPQAARRALDHAGLKLSLEGWQSLSLENRAAIAEAGSTREVDVSRVLSRCAAAQPPGEVMAVLPDPDEQAPPPALVSALGADRPLVPAVWAALDPVDRHTLVKVLARRQGEGLSIAYDEIVGASRLSSHLAPAGGARMVDVGHKAETRRRAVATSAVRMTASAFDLLASQQAPKGDVLGTARIAGILAAKRTAELIPLCHPLSLTRVVVELTLDAGASCVRIEAAAETLGRTGVEMEALTAASVAALTVYDMLKGVDRAMEIGPTRLEEKSGGARGDFVR